MKNVSLEQMTPRDVLIKMKPTVADIARESRMACVREFLNRAFRRGLKESGFTSGKAAAGYLETSQSAVSQFEERLAKMDFEKVDEMLQRVGTSLKEAYPDRQVQKLAVMKAVLREMRQVRKDAGEPIDKTDLDEADLTIIDGLNLPAIPAEAIDSPELWEKWLQRARKRLAEISAGNRVPPPALNSHRSDPYGDLLASARDWLEAMGLIPNRYLVPSGDLDKWFVCGLFTRETWDYHSEHFFEFNANWLEWIQRLHQGCPQVFLSWIGDEMRTDGVSLHTPTVEDDLICQGYLRDPSIRLPSGFRPPLPLKPFKD